MGFVKRGQVIARMGLIFRSPFGYTMIAIHENDRRAGLWPHFLGAANPGALAKARIDLFADAHVVLVCYCSTNPPLAWVTRRPTRLRKVAANEEGGGAHRCQRAGVKAARSPVPALASAAVRD
jgi:hypothetical protein